MSDQNEPKRNFDLASFTRASEKMIGTNDRAYSNVNSYWRDRVESLREYSMEDVVRIINSGSLLEQQKLSRNYFYRNGYYKQIIIYYATLLKYAGILIPNPSAGKSLSTPHIQKRYFSAMDLVENMHLPVWLTNCAVRALVDGCYYGVRVDTAKNEFAVLDLPAEYCRSRFKDTSGNDLIEFDLSYFDTIIDVNDRQAALTAYPKVVAKAYKKYSVSSLKSKWFIIPSNLGVCFPFFESRPLFLSVIPATLDYDDAVANHRDLEAESIRKIIVQTIPHLTDGRLLFEPDEAEEIHVGTVGMLKGNKNVSVLTTYADVNAIVSNPSEENVDDVLTRIEKNIYAQAGVSSEIFASTGSGTLEKAINNDVALMMFFANKVGIYVTNVLNEKYGNGNVTFKYTFMPVTHYNTDSFTGSAFKLVGSGYSFLLPSLAFGITQKDLGNLKDLENDVLKLGDKLKPLSTSYTQSGSSSEESEKTSSDEKEDTEDEEQTSKTTEETKTTQVKQSAPLEGGRPPKKEEDKSEKTIKNEESKH